MSPVVDYYKPKYHAIQLGERFYKTCANQGFDKEFYIQGCNLPDNFQTWFSITQLHVWMLMVRLRPEPNGKEIVQQMVNFYFLDAEQRIKDAGVTSGKIVSTTVKDLVAGFHGGVMAYDEGLCKDDAVLTAALWRNLFTTISSHQHGKEMAYMTRYVREQLSRLDSISSEKLQSGIMEFTQPKASL
ncbi:Serine carboxypeptidase 3, variant 2 [Basidiobolus ranarum]